MGPADFMPILVFDCETSGKTDKRRPADHPCQPRLVSLAAIVFSDDGKQEIHSCQIVVKPEGFVIPAEATEVHGISQEFAMEHGIDCRVALHTFMHLYWKSKLAMTYNWEFDNAVIRRECGVLGVDTCWLDPLKGRCIMLAASAAMKLPNEHGFDSYAWPKLGRAYEWLFHQKLEGAHNSMNDARAAGWLAFGIRDLGLWDMERIG